ncbi:MAG TPA: BMP family protein [Acidimicrobiales bacterium]|nr:BMP family protein [Acidimicrobiales bacterium]
MRSVISKARWLVPLALGATLLASACSSSGSKTTATTSAPATSAAPTGSSTPSAKALKVALILPSAKNDMSFSQSMYDALQGLKDKFNLTISVTDNAFVVQDAANAIRQYASQGYNLVIAHGSQYGSTLQQLASQFPKVSFAWGTAGSTFNQPNIFAYQIAANEGAYVQGYIGALISKSHTLGMIGPINVGDGQLYADGFKAGALAADPKANVRTTFTGSFSDVSLMANAAKAFIAGGADILTGSAQAVVGAIGVAKTSNVAWFGNDADQATLAPQQVVSSNVYDWTGILTQMFTAIDSGTLGGASYTATLGNGGMKVVFNSGYTIPSDVKAKAQDVIDKITSGALTVPQ